MAQGGIFDTVYGGFFRYSTDIYWHVPHFEKMLYDNAQLLSIYSKGYRHRKDPLYKTIIDKTYQFLTENFRDINGGYYSSQDADSFDDSNKLKEGSYYTWSIEELKRTIPEFDIFSKVFRLDDWGQWDNQQYVLIQTEKLKDIANQLDIDFSSLETLKSNWEQLLEKKRSERISPVIDKKIICSWNAMLAIGFIDCYITFGEQHFLDQAKSILNFIEKYCVDASQKIKHTANSQHNLGFIEDYAWLIKAYIEIYQCTLDETYLINANQWTLTTFDLFFSTKENYFQTEPIKEKHLLPTVFETEDNVIPSANAIMCQNIYRLGLLFMNSHYQKVHQSMTEQQYRKMDYISVYSQWCSHLIESRYLNSQISIYGPNATNDLLTIRKENFLPYLWYGTNIHNSKIPLLDIKNLKVKSTEYMLCYNNVCYESSTNFEQLAVILDQKINF